MVRPSGYLFTQLLERKRYRTHSSTTRQLWCVTAEAAEGLLLSCTASWWLSCDGWSDPTFHWVSCERRRCWFGTQASKRPGCHWRSQRPLRSIANSIGSIVDNYVNSLTHRLCQWALLSKSCWGAWASEVRKLPSPKRNTFRNGKRVLSTQPQMTYEVRNWAVIATAMEAQGATDSQMYRRAKALAEGKPDPMPTSHPAAPFSISVAWGSINRGIVADPPPPPAWRTAGSAKTILGNLPSWLKVAWPFRSYIPYRDFSRVNLQFPKTHLSSRYHTLPKLLDFNEYLDELVNDSGKSP